MAEARVIHGYNASSGKTLPIRVDANGKIILGTGSGFYPEVTNFAALPAAVDHNGEIYIVLQGSGVYMVNRKSAGLYLSNGTSWSRLGNIPAYFSSTNFKVYDGSDNTKQVGLDVSGITTATTRTLTVQDKDGTIATLADVATPNPTDTVIPYNNAGSFADSPISTDTNNITIDAGIKKNITEVAVATTITDTDKIYTLLCDASGGGFTVTIPTAADNSGRVLVIKKIAGGAAQTVTVDGEGAETIDGSATQSIQFQYDSLTIQSDGTEWWII